MSRAIKCILLLMLLLISLLAVAGAWLTLTQSGLHTLARAWLPDNVRFDKLHGRVTGPIRLEKLQIELPGATVNIAQLALDWSLLDSVRGYVRITPLEITGLEVELKDSPQPTQGQPFTMPIVLDITEATIRDIVVRDDHRQWQVQSANFAALLKQQQVSVARLTLTTETLQAGGAGKLTWVNSEPVDFVIDWKYRPKNSPELAGKSHFSGSLAALELVHETFAPFVFTATGSAQPLLDLPTWRLNVDIPEFVPSKANQGWPDTRVAAQFVLQGKANLIKSDGTLWLPDWQPRHLAFDGVFAVNNDRVVIDDLNLAFEGEPTQARMAGDIVWAPTFEFALSGAWQPMEWPLSEVAQMRSPMGTFQASGNADTYQGRFSTQLASLADSEFPVSADVDAAFLGDLQHIDFHEVKIMGDDIQAEGTVQIAWQPPAVLHAQFASKRINPAIFHTTLDGHLSSDLAVDVSWPAQQGPPKIVVDNRIEGVVNQQPVTGDARFQTTSTKAFTSELELQVGANTLAATGMVGEQLALAWTLDAPELGHLVPQLAGQLNSRGRVTGPRQTPQIDLIAEGSQLRWQDIEIGELNTDINFDIATDKLEKAQVDVQNMQWQGVEFSRVSASTKGSVTAHDIIAELTATEGRLHLRASGSYDEQQWRGQLLNLESESEQLGNWQLEDAVAIEISAQAIATNQACLSDTPARLCLGGRWSTPEAWSLQASLNHFELDRFAPWLSDAYDYQGELGATIQLEQTPDQAWQGLVTIDLDKSVIKLADEPTPLTELNAGQLRVSADAHRLDLVLNLDLPQQDGINAQIHAARVGPDATLAGHVQGQLANLEFVSLLVPELLNVSGELVMDLDVAGTLNAPSYTGQLSLVDGVATVVDAGITIEEIGFQLDGSSHGLELTGSARSGEGDISLSGALDWLDDKPSGHFALNGEQFRLVDLPEVQVDASPHLTLDVLGRQLDLSGNIHVDEAHIRGVNLAPTRIATSPDEVIITDTPAEPLQWLVSSRIAVTLGEVSVDAYGLRGNAQGALDIVDLPGQPARASGQLTIHDGYYKAYGQFLNIERGRLVFGGGPLNNPMLDVRAIRHYESVSAGVEVRGSLTKPQMTVFSIPPKPHQYALALLLMGDAPVELGRASDHLAYGAPSSQLERSFGLGGASTGLGTYLSPDFYLGYLEAFNMRFRLTRKWSIEMARSIEATSLGVIYSIR